MLKIGIAGGIGSGKSTVCRIFEHLGAPIYYADSEAKMLMSTNEVIVSELVQLFGKQIYMPNGELDRARLAGIIFNDSTALQKVNALVHPQVALHFEKWVLAQKSAAYVLKEAAILFESGSYKAMDFNVLVTAPTELRIERCMARDGATAEDIRRRIANQWTDEKKAELSDFLIINDETQLLIPQIISLHNQFLTKNL